MLVRLIFILTTLCFLCSVSYRIPFENILLATRPIPLPPSPFAHDADAHFQLVKSDHIPHGTGALPAPLSHSLPAVFAGGWEGH